MASTISRTSTRSEAESSPSHDQSDPEKPGGQRSPYTAKKSKRKTLTKNACYECRRSKAKCDGTRPTCARCTDRNTLCSYEVPLDGMTKMQDLAAQLKQVSESTEVLDALFRVMREAPDGLAAFILARIRMGEAPERILGSLNSGGGTSMLSVPEDPRDMDASGEEVDSAEWQSQSRSVSDQS